MASPAVSTVSEEASERDAWLAELRDERRRRLERENEHLRAERARLELLLGLTLLIATDQPRAFLETLCELVCTEPSVPAWVEHRRRMQLDAQLDKVVDVLRETA